jgi:hypothetical protein
MRRTFLPLAMLLMSGCAGRPSAAPEAFAPPAYLDAPAVALAFKPSVALDEPPVHLPREARNPAAFVSFDQLSTTFFYIRTDDRHTTDRTDRFIRWSVQEKVGISYR